LMLSNIMDLYADFQRLDKQIASYDEKIKGLFNRACHQLSQTTLATKYTAPRKFCAVLS
jgi:hypothetical protein